jgi:hypothetical protein
MIDTKELYNRNSDFRKYVNAYADKYNEGKSISVYDALEHLIVKEVAYQIGGIQDANIAN